MGRFFREWGTHLRLASPALKHGGKLVGHFLTFLAVLFGAGVVVIFRTAEIPLPAWASISILLVVWWLSFTAGMATVTSRYPQVAISDLEIDDQAVFTVDGKTSCGVLFITITNGDIPLTPRVEVTGVSGGIKWIEHGLAAQWRWHKEGYAGHLLNSGSTQQFGLLGIGKRPNDHPGLFIWSSIPEKKPFITRDLPLSEQGVISIFVTITGDVEPEKDKEGKEIKKDRIIEKRVFYISPDLQPASIVPYKVFEKK